jgi:hypothetical protein
VGRCILRRRFWDCDSKAQPHKFWSWKFFRKLGAPNRNVSKINWKFWNSLEIYFVYVGSKYCVTLHFSCCSVTQYTPKPKLNFTIGGSFCWLTLLEFMNYNPWRWPFKGWNMLELRIVLINCWFNDIWVYLSVFVWCSDNSARLWTRWRCKLSSPLYACIGTEGG